MVRLWLGDRESNPTSFDCHQQRRPNVIERRGSPRAGPLQLNAGSIIAYLSTGLPTVSPHAELPCRSMADMQGRTALVHWLAHIGMSAVDLGLDIIWRFAGLTAPYKPVYNKKVLYTITVSPEWFR